MDEPWNRLSAGADLPQSGPDPTVRERLRLPATLRPVGHPGVRQAAVFDPALLHFPHAYHPGDPRFGDPAQQEAWRAARRDALDAVLAAIAASPWSESLVLRGSVLLTAWFGARAREPGDLDFVVVPPHWAIEDPRTDRMLDDITARVAALARDGLRFLAEEAVSDEIWTYERVPGRRLVLPWSAEGLPGGTGAVALGGSVQLDFVFNEPLPVPPDRVTVPPLGPHGGHGDVVLNAATPELSLAWKIMWLLGDLHPQGKDLYDAVLLAEHHPLRRSLLREVMAAGDPVYAYTPVHPDDVLGLDIDAGWQHFAREYPQLADGGGGAGDALLRLSCALAPVLTQHDAPELPGRSCYRCLTAWIGPAIEHYRGPFRTGGLDAALDAMLADGLRLRTAVVVANALREAGPEELPRTKGLVLGSPAGAGPGPWARQDDHETRLHLAELASLRPGGTDSPVR